MSNTVKLPNGTEVEIKLNIAEQDMVDKLDPVTAKVVTESLLNAKREALIKVQTNRQVFSAQFNEYGVIVIRGLNNRFPLGLRPDMLETIFEHSEELKALIAKGKSMTFKARPKKSGSSNSSKAA